MYKARATVHCLKTVYNRFALSFYSYIDSPFEFQRLSKENMTKCPKANISKNEARVTTNKTL